MLLLLGIGISVVLHFQLTAVTLVLKRLELAKALCLNRNCMGGWTAGFNALLYLWTSALTGSDYSLFGKDSNKDLVLIQDSEVQIRDIYVVDFLAPWERAQLKSVRLCMTLRKISFLRAVKSRLKSTSQSRVMLLHVNACVSIKYKAIYHCILYSIFQTHGVLKYFISWHLTTVTAKNI